jgi:hypothetical protein
MGISEVQENEALHLSKEEERTESIVDNIKRNTRSFRSFQPVKRRTKTHRQLSLVTV